jgi:hypothetical protein
MKHSQARQIKWDIVDHLLAHFAEGEMAVADYTPEEREYAEAQIRRIAGMLNVTNHIDL